MPNTRWYSSLLEGLPPTSRRRLSTQLRRSVRTDSLPSRRSWRNTVERAASAYRPFM